MIRLTERTIFLVDGIGAVLSALLTGLVLPRLGLGLPDSTFYGLAAFPVVYGIYSMTCFRATVIKPWMLLGVITANSIYCVVSGLVLLLSTSITPWGQAVLLGEIVVVLAVVTLEAHVYRRAF